MPISRQFSTEEITVVCAAVKEACTLAGTEAFLIGAQARDLWMFPKKSFRLTKDIDWVVGTNNRDVYQDVRSILIQKFAFTERSSNQFKLISPNGFELDLLPMVSEELVHFLALQEIFEFGVDELVVDGQSYRAATLPSIVLLKLIAWDNLPENRGKDLKDIFFILKHFFEHNDDIIFEYHNDLFGELDNDQIGARVIGREIKKILQTKPEIIEIIFQILEKKDKLVKVMLESKDIDTDISEEKIHTLLHEIVLGLNE